MEKVGGTLGRDWAWKPAVDAAGWHLLASTHLPTSTDALEATALQVRLSLGGEASWEGGAAPGIFPLIPGPKGFRSC